MKSKIKAAAMEVRFQLACREQLVPLMWPYRIGRTRRRRRKVPGYDTRESYTNAEQKIIIDGFPGSANSYATELFVDLQGDSFVFGHHFHSPAETIRGMKMGIPVLLTLRHPVDAVCSMVRRWPFVKYERALVWYRMFYEAFEPYVDRITACDFSLLVSEFSQVIHSLNDKHGTEFNGEVTDSMKETRKPRTNEDREKKRVEKDRLRRELEDSSSSMVIDQAVTTYERFLGRPEVLRARKGQTS